MQKLNDLATSEPITPGEYDCICAPDVTGMIVHEAFGHGVEMDMFVKKRALAEKYIGEYVASPLVTMHDGASAASETATFFFDDEGTLAQDTVIIDNSMPGPYSILVISSIRSQSRLFLRPMKHIGTAEMSPIYLSQEDCRSILLIEYMIFTFIKK